MGHMKPLIPYMSELSTRGHKITLFCANDPKIEKELQKEGITDITIVVCDEVPLNSKVFFDSFEGNKLGLLKNGGPLAMMSAGMFSTITSYYDGKTRQPPDAMVVDCMVSAAVDASDSLQIPVVIVNPCVSNFFILPPPEDRSLGDHMKSFFFDILGSLLNRLVRHMRNTERKKRNLPKLKEQDFFPCIYQTRHIISLSVIGFENEFEQSPLLHLVGPSPPRNPPPLQTDLSEWLNQQEKPVVYVAFGTANTFTKETVIHLSDEFQSLSDDFSILWSLPFDQQAYLSQIKISQTLKIENFVPQWNVLAHPSVKSFITHNGINSTYEAILNEVPMVCCPQGKDQFVNAALVEKAGVGIIVKDGADGSVAKFISDLFRDFSSFEKKAKQLNCLFSKQGGAKKASDIIEEIAERGFQPNGEDSALKPKMCW